MNKANGHRRFIAAEVVLLSLLFSACATAAPRSETRDYTDPSNLAALITGDSSQYILLDVRTAEEFSGGHIPTAQNLPYDQIMANRPTWDRNKLVITYCASGHRAAIARDALLTLGFTDVVNFGGVGRWEGDLIKGK